MHRLPGQEFNVVEPHSLSHAFQPAAIHAATHEEELGRRYSSSTNLRRAEHAVEALGIPHGAGKEDAEAIRGAQSRYGFVIVPKPRLVTPVVDHFDLVRRNSTADELFFKTPGKHD